jgi:type I restriction enzyme S subunit
VIEFYRDTEFEETEIGKIPKNWEVVTLEKISMKIKTGPFGSQLKKSELSESGVKIYTQENILKRDFSLGNLYISHDKFRQLKNMEIRPGDVLLTIRGSIGYSAILPEKAERGIIHTNLAYIRVRKELVLPEFLFALINDYDIVRSQIMTLASTTTLGALYAKHIKRIKIPLPSLEEQRFIVKILSTVDQAFQAMDKAIAKTERLKKGLMQELLTKGIGHKEFKKTEIGRIPLEWKIARLEDEGIATIRRGRVKELSERLAFITMEKIPDNELYARFEMRNIHEVRSYVYCEAGDILLAKITPCFENGKQGVVPDDVPNGFALATTEVYPIVCEGIDRFFLFYLLKFPRFRKRLESAMRGTTGRQRVPRKAVENLKIPLPPLEEQKRIAQILMTIDGVLENKRKKKDKLQRMKKALMNLLLTGKARVRT